MSGVLRKLHFSALIVLIAMGISILVYGLVVSGHDLIIIRKSLREFTAISDKIESGTPKSTDIRLDLIRAEIGVEIPDDILLEAINRGKIESDDISLGNNYRREQIRIIEAWSKGVSFDRRTLDVNYGNMLKPFLLSGISFIIGIIWTLLRVWVGWLFTKEKAVAIVSE